MHDVPYIRPPAPLELVSTMTRVCAEVRQVLGNRLVMGVQLLAGKCIHYDMNLCTIITTIIMTFQIFVCLEAGCNKEALAVSLASGGNFIRAEGFVFAHVSDEGWMDGCAGELLRYRKSLDAEDILVLTDIKKKHRYWYYYSEQHVKNVIVLLYCSSHAITADVSISETARAAEFFLSDGVVVTGVSTGECVDSEEFEAVLKTVNVPVIIGSGVTVKNIHQFRSSDAIVVGSYFKRGGVWWNEISEERVSALMAAFHNC